MSETNKKPIGDCRLPIAEPRYSLLAIRYSLRAALSTLALPFGAWSFPATETEGPA